MEIKTVLTVAGEFVGKTYGETAEGITLEDPRRIIISNAGGGFSGKLSATSVEDPKSATFGKAAIVLVLDTDPDIAKMYREAVSGIILQ